VRATPHLCSFPGCDQIIDNGPGRCEQHRYPRRRAGPPSPGYNDRRWRKLRAAYLAEHPTCQTVGCTRPARIVHHRDHQGVLGPHGHDWNNLASMCDHHHRLITSHPEAVELDG
jgi:5-methylcytosine-specific restriction enzyme A